MEVTWRTLKAGELGIKIKNLRDYIPSWTALLWCMTLTDMGLTELMGLTEFMGLTGKSARKKHSIKYIAGRHDFTRKHCPYLTEIFRIFS